MTNDDLRDGLRKITELCRRTVDEPSAEVRLQYIITARRLIEHIERETRSESYEERRGRK